MQDILIVGNGPAGISAALYAARAGMRTTVIGRDGGALGKAEKIENYYGFPQPIAGKQLLENGRAQAARLGVQLITEEVVSLGFEDTLAVTTAQNRYTAPAVILATGSARKRPDIGGFAEFEGHGVSYCAVCDAFFYKGRDVAVLGCCEFALHEAMELLPVAGSVTIVTNGVPAIEGIPPEIRVVETEIAGLAGDGTLREIRFADGSTLPAAGLFVAIGVAGSGDLARQIGAATEKTSILVNERMETNIPGLYAAGDCTGGFLQIAKAVHEGAVAGTQAVKYLRSLR